MGRKEILENYILDWKGWLSAMWAAEKQMEKRKEGG